jgi:sporulation protein YlmC with PRC-barrel domain
VESGERRPNLVKMSDADFRLDEPWQDVRGLDVYDLDGEQAGSVEELSVEPDSRFPRFLVVSAGGFLGVGKKRFLVPIEEVSRDMGEERVTVNRDSDKVVGSPNFEANEAPPSDVQRAVLAYYGLLT